MPVYFAGSSIVSGRQDYGTVVSNIIETDPLAGIVFALRLQAQQGDNVPIGLYQDTACTIPALLDGDPIAAWRDELGTSGLILIQSDSQKQPMLLFDGGTPTVYFDGVDDFLAVTSANLALQPYTAFVIGSADNGTNSRFFENRNGGARSLFGPQDANSFLMYAGSLGPQPAATFPNAMAQWTCVFNGASSLLRKNGAQVATGDPGANGIDTGLIIGATHDGSGEFLTGAMSAMLLKSGAVSGAQLTLIESYLSTLI